MSGEHIGSYKQGNWLELGGDDLATRASTGNLGRGMLADIIDEELAKTGRVVETTHLFEETPDGRYAHLLAAEPPFTDEAEAVAAGAAIALTWDQEAADCFRADDQPYLDAFLPRQASVEDDDSEGIYAFFGHPVISGIFTTVEHLLASRRVVSDKLRGIVPEPDDREAFNRTLVAGAAAGTIAVGIASIRRLRGSSNV